MSERITAENLGEAIYFARKRLLYNGRLLPVQRWQAIASPDQFLELINVSITSPMAETEELAYELTGSTPWARTHHLERVSGQPLNPPPSHYQWARGTEEFMSKSDPDRFSHSYPERLWPADLYSGIRYKVGDLNTAAQLLRRDPTTRQCWVPMILGEDLTASLEGERVPCSIGWGFTVRDNRLHCHYPIRSCDAARHIHHDIYFANMLTLWMIEAADLSYVKAGELFMNITNLHCFERDRASMELLIQNRSIAA